MLKDLGNNTWGFISEGRVQVKARRWFYENLPADHSLYRVGIIGDFSCESQTDLSSSKQVLDRLCEELYAMGATRIIGPMDGSTWQNYRLTTYRGEEAPFYLEAYTPSYYVNHWTQAGFSQDESYSSYKAAVDSWQDKRVDKLVSRFSHLTFRSIEVNDLGAIFDLSLNSFQRNPYYIPIEKEVYLSKYKQILEKLMPNISLVVYDKEDLVGYLFALIDPYEPSGKRAILKTVAINEERKYAGLGLYMLSKLIDDLKQREISTLIHALMYDGNPVQNIIKDSSILFRKYALYTRSKPCQ